MFFELEGITYRIKFYRVGLTTVAELFEILDEDSEKGKSTYVSLGIYGLGKPHHSEHQFVKSIGRKAALANLLKALSTDETALVPLTKDERQMIWAKYFESHRK